MTQGKEKDMIQGTSCKSVPVSEKDVNTIYMGPTVEGPDEEYVKVWSRKVEHKKPSFA